MSKKFGWLLGAAGLAVGLSSAGHAQEQAQGAEGDTPTTAQEIVVQGEIVYRDRSVSTAPVLEYGLDYFQRFEPLTAGDALKRVPSVAFLSDVTESDGVRLRGLDPAYTQILINGEEVPGAGSGSGTFGNGADGAFFVDRIPAELIERVEIVRSASANRSGDAVAGGINIVLRDALALDGGYVRAGLLYFSNDGHWGETLGGVWGGEALGGRILVGGNLQDRHNPKDKFSARFDEPGSPLVDIEDQTDVRDGTDYSANFSYQRDLGPGEFSLGGWYVHTDRNENEDSIEFENIEDPITEERPPATAADIRTPDNLKSINDNNTDIEQDSLTLNAGYEFDALGGETRIKGSWARFENQESEFEDEAAFEFGPGAFDEFESELTELDIEDTEVRLKLEHERDLGAFDLEVGVHYERKERDTLLLEAGADSGDEADVVFGGVFARQEVAAGNEEFEPADGGDNSIERTQIDPYVQFSGEFTQFEWEAGLRYETTELDVTDRVPGDPAETFSNEYEVLLPSAHLRWNLTDNDRVSFSLARTVRNPSFEYLSPARIGEFGDNEFVGNPLLEPETAWGVDIGFERRLGRVGIFGVNAFYRDVTDLIEVFNTGDLSEEYLEELEEFLDDNPGATEEEIQDELGQELFTYSARNTGDGKVWGIEFDLSTPLTVIGLPNTGAFANYSWLDSDVDDEFGSRRFNDQAEFVLNVGFIHDLPTLGAAFGASYRKQGDAESRVVGEEVVTKYGADLEAFVEKRFGEKFVIRFTGSNLLDESKDETFNKFDTAADQVDRDFDEFEIESESSGPYFQLIGRYAF